ncbi:50S ribosomal protein L5 [Candidatus Tiddalikarchaeum anstoanum]|nr:50S ribosomal protein L5 [Candidatus Tiddalikarchaeum anstoanum]
MTDKINPMREVRIEKVTLNIGVGEPGDKLESAFKLLERLTERKPVRTSTKKRIPKWNVRPGLILGVKVNIRRDYDKLLKRLLGAVDFNLKKSNFDDSGNVSFGIDEYIHIPEIKYDPKMPMFGMNVTITLERRGYRIKRRRLMRKPIGEAHKVTQEDAINFMKEKYGVVVA